jgi:hypothetical protein
MQIPANAHMIFNPVALFEVTFPEPASAVPIHVTVPGSQLSQNGTEKTIPSCVLSFLAIFH